MLNLLRRGVQTWYFKGLLIMLASSFVLWGAGDFTSGSRGNAVATVGDQDISGPTVINAFNRQMRQFRGSITAEQARQLGVLDQVLNGLIDESLYDAEGADLGVRVSNDAVVKEIHAETAFRDDLTKKFNRATFQQVLSQNGLSEQQYVDSLRRTSARQQVLGGFGAAAAPKVIVDRIHKWRQERRVADVLSVPIDITINVGAPDDAALTAIHKTREAQFTAPEYRKAVAIRLKADDLKDEIDVSDGDLKEAYDQRQHEFSVSERRKVLQMVLPDADKAKAAGTLLAEGRTFEDVAKTIADQDKSSTDLGAISKDDLPEDLAAAVFKLNKGETSGPLTGPFGVHIFRVTDILTGSVKSFDEVRQELKDNIAADRAIDALYKLANTLDDTLGGGASLEEAARQLNVKLTRYAALDQQGGGLDGKLVEGLPAGDKFLPTLFETDQGEDSQLTETGDGEYFVLRVESITPSAVRPLDSVRAQVAAVWRSEQQVKHAKDTAQGILDALKEGKMLAALAVPHGLTVKTSQPFKRNGAGAEASLPAGLIADLFNRKAGDSAMGQTATGFSVAVLKSIKSAVNDPSNDKAALEATRNGVLRGITSDIVVQYNNALRKRHSVEINQRVMDSLIAANP
jgi:peptidyl-prolyl cis-trans isomerase D